MAVTTCAWHDHGMHGFIIPSYHHKPHVRAEIKHKEMSLNFHIVFRERVKQSCSKRRDPNQSPPKICNLESSSSSSGTEVTCFFL